MLWILTVALFALSITFFATGQVALALLTTFLFLLNLVRCILRTIRKAIWLLIRKPLAIVLAVVLVLMIITSIPILWGVKSQGEESCDYLILLGAGVDGDTPSPILQDRINQAYAYLTAHPDTICIVTGGKGDDENLSEAQCMFDHLTQMGIEADRIWMEDRATSTVENFQYSLELLEEKTGSREGKLGVMSNEFHLFRASLIAKKNGIEPICISAPTSNLTVRINYTVREIFVLWKYLIIGG